MDSHVLYLSIVHGPRSSEYAARTRIERLVLSIIIYEITFKEVRDPWRNSSLIMLGKIFLAVWPLHMEIQLNPVVVSTLD